MPTEQFFFASDMPVTIDKNYGWQLQADTHQLADDDWLRAYFKEQMRQIYWDLGFSSVQDQAL